MLGIDQFDTLATKLRGVLAGLLHTQCPAPGYHRLIDLPLRTHASFPWLLGQTGHRRTSEPTGHQASGHPLKKATVPDLFASKGKVLLRKLFQVTGRMARAKHPRINFRVLEPAQKPLKATGQ